MSYVEIFFLAVALSMDAVAVALCKGLAMKKITIKDCLNVGLWFGFFQGLMPFIGYILGSSLSNFISELDHWVAFILLGIIGINMIRESFSDEDEEEVDNHLNFKAMLLMAIATSIDALAVGVTFAFLQVNILTSILLIGITTFVLSSIAVKVGSIFGDKLKSKAELLGGIVLVLIGTKILVEHLGLFNF